MKRKILGYCQLCRSKEIEIYGSVLNADGPSHTKACEEAGCKHPPYYILEPK